MSSYLFSFLFLVGIGKSFSNRRLLIPLLRRRNEILQFRLLLPFLFFFSPRRNRIFHFLLITFYFFESSLFFFLSLFYPRALIFLFFPPSLLFYFFFFIQFVRYLLKIFYIYLILAFRSPFTVPLSLGSGRTSYNFKYKRRNKLVDNATDYNLFKKKLFRF